MIMEDMPYLSLIPVSRSREAGMLFDVVFIQGVGRAGIKLVEPACGLFAVFRRGHSHRFQAQDI